MHREAIISYRRNGLRHYALHRTNRHGIRLRYGFLRTSLCLKDG